jgi:hypothetical protein
VQRHHPVGGETRGVVALVEKAREIPPIGLEAVEPFLRRDPEVAVRVPAMPYALSELSERGFAESWWNCVNSPVTGSRRFKPPVFVDTHSAPSRASYKARMSTSLMLPG